jgi:O-antigen/teichoic acid export membrane protein
MSLKQKAAKGVVWTAVQNWGSQVVSLAIFFVLARLLGPAEFGLVALADVFLVFMQVFLAEGFAKALIQRQQIDHSHLDTVFWLNLGMSLLLCAITLGSAGWLAQQFDTPALAPILRAFSVLFVITSFSTVQQAVLERAFAFRVMALRSLVAMAVSGGVGVTMALAGAGVWSLVGQRIVYELLAVAVLWRLSDWRPGLSVNLAALKQLWGFGINTFGFNVLTFFHSRADDLLIGYFLGATALGYYSVAYRVLTILTYLLVNTSQQVALPVFSRLQDDLPRLRQAYCQATQLTSLIALPTFVGVAVLAQPLVLVVFGDQWLPAVPVLQLLALAGVTRSVTYFKSAVLMAMNKPHWRFWLGLVDTTLNVLAFVVAVRWGITAVALAYLIRAYLMFPVGQWVVGALIDLPWITYLKQLAAPLLATGIMVVPLLVLEHQLGDSLLPLARVALGSAVGAAIYVGTFVVFAPDLCQEVRKLTRLALGNSSSA